MNAKRGTHINMSIVPLCVSQGGRNKCIQSMYRNKVLEMMAGVLVNRI